MRRLNAVFSTASVGTGIWDRVLNARMNSAFILAAAAALLYAVARRSAVVAAGGRSFPRGAVYFGRFPWLRLAGHHSPPSQGA